MKNWTVSRTKFNARQWALGFVVHSNLPHKFDVVFYLFSVHFHFIIARKVPA